MHIVKTFEVPNYSIESYINDLVQSNKKAQGWPVAFCKKFIQDNPKFFPGFQLGDSIVRAVKEYAMLCNQPPALALQNTAEMYLRKSAMEDLVIYYRELGLDTYNAIKDQYEADCAEWENEPEVFLKDLHNRTLLYVVPKSQATDKKTEQEDDDDAEALSLIDTYPDIMTRLT